MSCTAILAERAVYGVVRRLKPRALENIMEPVSRMRVKGDRSKPSTVPTEVSVSSTGISISVMYLRCKIHRSHHQPYFLAHTRHHRQHISAYVSDAQALPSKTVGGTARQLRG
jgi:hypothetical protein|eukprot:COSAG01_NODE_4949_length_4597_cov_2.576478_3_plen_113_part_00